MTVAISAARVSLVLKKAGHRRSVSTKSAVRGLPLESAGFKVSQRTNTEVRVDYRTGSVFRDANITVEDQTRLLEKYAATLREQGFVAEVVAPYGPSTSKRVLTVTKEA